MISTTHFPSISLADTVCAVADDTASGESLFRLIYPPAVSRQIIKAAATATAATGAAIVSYTFSGAFSKTVQTSATSTTQTSGVIATSGSKSVTVTVTDARGRTGTATVTCSYTSYAFPAVSALSYARGTYSGGTWTASDSGEDLRIVFSASCSLSSQGNSMTYSVPVMSATGSNSSGESVTLYRTGIGTVTAYTVTVTVTDSVGNSSSRSIYVPTVEIPFVIDPTLPAIGVGAVPQTARTLELASNWMLKTGAGIAFEDTTDVLASALAQKSGTIKAYRAAAGYSGTLPDSNYASGTFLVNKRFSTSISVIAFPATANFGIAINASTNGSTWQGWNVAFRNRYVDKTQAVSFSAGTIGTRAQSYSWTSSDIGGAPILMQVINSTGLANFMPICTIASSNAYLNIYRSVSTAYSSGSITVRIWY